MHELRKVIKDGKECLIPCEDNDTVPDIVPKEFMSGKE